MERRRRHDQGRPVAQAAGLQRLPVPGRPQLPGLAGRLALIPDGRDALAAQADKVRGGVPGRGHVVQSHVVERPVVDVLTEQHHRGVPGEAAQLGFAQAERAEDQPVEQVTPVVLVQQLLLPAGVAVGLLDHHRVGVPPGLGDDQPGQLGEVRHGQLRHGQPDHSGPPAPQVAGDQVGLIAELVDGTLHPLPQLVRDQRELVDDVGNGPGRDPGPARDVPLGHRQIRPP